jgi:PST family polysaccharide transporter
MSDKEKSYRNTAMLGVSSIINILLSIVRNKIFSLYLGPVGIGQFGMLNDFMNSVYSLGSLGAGSSGIQAISKASTESGHEVRRIFNTLLRVFTGLSLVLVAGVILFSGQISRSLAGDDSYIWLLRIGSLALLFRFRSGIQGMLLNGMKRVGMLAKSNIIQGVATTIIGLILVYFLRKDAVPFLVISIALVGFVVGQYQSRVVLKELPSHGQGLTMKELSPIFLLGFSSLWASFLESTVTILNKSWINHYFGQDYLGYYQVAIGFTGSYIGFITSSIITNYYPNLVTKVQEGNAARNDYVNQQVGMSMALIMPLLFVMLTFSKFFLQVLFSSKFLAADALIGYTVAGTFIQVVAWPIAYVFLAHRATKTYLLTESIGNGSMLILSYFAVRSGQFALLGLAFVLHYIIYLAVITFIFRNRFEGSLSGENIRLFMVNALIIGGIMVSKSAFSPWVTYLIGCTLIAAYFYRSRKEYLFMMNTILKKR